MKKTLVNLTPLDLTDQLPLPVVLPPCRAGPTSEREGQVEPKDLKEAAELLKAVTCDWT